MSAEQSRGDVVGAEGAGMTRKQRVQQRKEREHASRGAQVAAEEPSNDAKTHVMTTEGSVGRVEACGGSKSQNTKELERDGLDSVRSRGEDSKREGEESGNVRGNGLGKNASMKFTDGHNLMSAAASLKRKDLERMGRKDEDERRLRVSGGDDMVKDEKWFDVWMSWTRVQIQAQQARLGSSSSAMDRKADEVVRTADNAGVVSLVGWHVWHAARDVVVGILALLEWLMYVAWRVNRVQVERIVGNARAACAVAVLYIFPAMSVVLQVACPPWVEHVVLFTFLALFMNPQHMQVTILSIASVLAGLVLVSHNEPTVITRLTAPERLTLAFLLNNLRTRTALEARNLAVVSLQVVVSALLGDGLLSQWLVFTIGAHTSAFDEQPLCCTRM